MVDTNSTPPLVTLTQRLEGASALDRPVGLVQPLMDALLADRRRADLLHGKWLGHAVHPLLVMVPIGAWTSATVLDLIGGRNSRTAARRLVAFGLVMFPPAAVTGWAELGPTAQREKRVGLVHALSNATAAGFFASSWKSRKSDKHLRGALLSLAGHTALGAGGYLGGHLTEARKVGSRHPAFDDASAAGTGMP